MSRGRGYIPDDPEVVAKELVERHHEHLIGAPNPGLLVVNHDYTGFMTSIPDQGPTSSCVGQAFATCLFLTAAVSGRPIPRPAPKLIYDVAREKDRPYVKMIDEGSRPMAAAEGLSTFGMVAEADWPIVFNPDGSTNINDAPLLGIFEKALGYKLGSYYRIPAGKGASDAIDQALARGFALVFAMPVDEPYERLLGDVIYPGRTKPSLGGHMQCIGGNGPGYKKIVSSWGPTHGLNGIVKIANDYFESGECTDIIVPTIVPRLAA